ncbi:hypothetical protein [Actinoplanes sp. NPDC026619]|uniref:hypothetical protein n=1 Tax=Actinoplanes sp. NPDC026619 TaxID=3155798 RepID=UPI0033C93DCE
MGLFVIVLLVIATVLLIRNMNKRLRRLPDSFSDAEQTQREAEIARLNADLEQSGADDPAQNVDQDRSQAAPATTEDEVKGITTDSDALPAEGDQRRV